MTNSPRAIKEINFTNLHNVKVYSVSKDLYCGRRFRINDGAENVIFNDLFKKARKLARQADNPDQLSQVKAFIGELRKVEKIANVDYEKKDLPYKFISWFHRLFGGAFFGSHLERLDVLEGKVTSKLLVEELKSTIQQRLSRDDLPILKSFIDTGPVQLPWKEGFLTISYNEENEIVFTTTDNKQLRIDFQNDFALRGDVDEFKDLREAIQDLCVKVFAPRASYALINHNQFTVKVVKEEIEKIPAWHLHQLNQFIPSNRLKVTFLNQSLVQEEGVDAGGLRRDYVVTLIEKTKNLNHFFYRVDETLTLPRFNASMTDEARQLYFDLGRVLRICYENDELVSGYYFHHALFQAAKKLTPVQLQLSFDSIEKVAHGEMAKEVIKELDKSLSANNAMLFKVLDLLDPVKFQGALDREDSIFYDAISAAEIEYFTEDLLGVDFDKIRANTSQFIDELYHSIMNNPNLVTELNGVSLKSVIEPIYHIAKGLGESDWQDLQEDTDLAARIQGRMDRGIIANAINKIDDEIPDEKVNWLKDWIKNEASDDEVRHFLKYVIGTSSLPVDDTIDLVLGEYPDLEAHTCDNELHISKGLGDEFLDGTKEKFIENVKGAIQNTHFQIK